MGTYVDLLEVRTPLLVRQAEIERTRRYADAHNQDVHRFVEMLKMMNVAGSNDGVRFAAIERQANIANENMLVEGRKLDQLMAEQRAAQQEFFLRMFPRLESLAQLHVDALVALRSDLGVDAAVDVLRQELQRNLDALRRLQDRFGPPKT
jgi:hypothetical protein